MLKLSNEQIEANCLKLPSWQEYTCHDCFSLIQPYRWERPRTNMPGFTTSVYGNEYHHPGFTPDGVKYWIIICKSCHQARIAD